MAYANLGRYRGWEIYWEPREHKMYIHSPGLLFGSTKYFDERPRDRVTAFQLAKARINGD